MREVILCLKKIAMACSSYAPAVTDSYDFSYIMSIMLQWHAAHVPAVTIRDIQLTLMIHSTNMKEVILCCCFFKTAMACSSCPMQ